jgi:hypothetical protein
VASGYVVQSFTPAQAQEPAMQCGEAGATQSLSSAHWQSPLGTSQCE